MPTFVETSVSDVIQTSAGVPVETRVPFETGAEGTADQSGGKRRRYHRTRRHRRRTHKRTRATKRRVPPKPRSRKYSRKRRSQVGRGYGFKPLEGDFVGSQGSAIADVETVETGRPVPPSL